MTLKKISVFFILSFQFLAYTLSAQTTKVPDGILFQAIAKDPSGNPAKGRTIYIKNAILQTSINGPEVYLEAHKIVASQEGVFTIVIGKGNKLLGPNSITNLDWSSGPYFLNIKAAIAPSIPLANWVADEHYVDMGTSQFWTVPFALYAARVEGFELKLNIADTSAMLAPYLKKVDTINLSNRINSKLSASDTASLSSRINAKLNITDTASLSSRINRRLVITDTAAMLINYAKKNAIPDTNSLSNRINSKLSASDTVSLSSRINFKLTASDTASLSARINTKLNVADTASLSSRINRRLVITDTAAMLINYAKKNDIPDTASLSTRINSKLTASDTVSLSSRINRRLVITDTATMLINYAKKNDIPDTASLSNRINFKLTATDTASLSNRINSKLTASDTASLSTRINSKLTASDTVSLSSRINRRLVIADTAAMLINYAKKYDIPDTTSLSNRVNSKLTASDTVSLSSRVLAKLSIADTAVMLNNYAKRADILDTISLSNRINNKESINNKTLILSADRNSDIKYPSAKAVKHYVDSLITINSIAGNNTSTSSVSVVDADANTKGIIQLTGDLAGTAVSPRIASGVVTNDKIANGISAVKVGLGNVTNTSDADKPVSILQQAALDTKLAIADTALMLNRRIGRDTIFLSQSIEAKENSINKSLDINTDASSDVKFPSVKAVKTYVDSSIVASGNGGGNSNNSNSNVTDADATNKGILKLAGDLSGTAALPLVANGAIVTSKIANGAVTDLKIANGISASKVGLGNVDNTSDIDKPISTLTQAALDTKYSNAQAQALIGNLNNKVNISDTSTMLSARFARDTLFISNRINQKVNLADSGTVYATPYQIIANTFDSTSLSDRINLKYDAANGDILFNRINTKLNAVDTVYLSNRINSKLNIADSSYGYVTPTRLLNAATDTSQLSNRIDEKLNTADTARMLRDYMLKAGLSSVATTGNYLDLINKPVLSNNSGAVTSVNSLIGDIVIDKSSLGLGNVDNTSDANKPISFLTNNALTGKISSSLINAPNGVAGLDANTKIPSSLLPPISFTAISVVANAAEMQTLGMSSVKGTVCVRTDVSKSFILNTDFSTSLSDWIELLTPGAPVQSVNGNIGVVNLKTNNIGELTNLYFTDARARAALTANAPVLFNPTTGVFSIDTSNNVNSIATKWNVLQQTAASTSGLALKVNISDTANMLYPYAKNYQVANGLAAKLSIADTSYMLSQRIGKDTLSLSNRLNAKLSITDTAFMLSSRIARDTILLSERISSKVSIADTSVMLSSRFARDTAALSNRINLKLNISDTALMLSKRFARDTAALSNRINLKLNTADTAAMLTSYLASIHTKENSVNKSTDTSLGGLSPSNVLFPTQLAVKKYIENNAATISSSSTGNVVDATTSIKGKIQLAGDLGGTAASPQVLSIGGILKDTLAEAINLMKASTPDNIVNYIVRRSPVGDFSGSTITANTFRGNLIGNVTGNVTGNITGNVIGSLSGNATNVSGIVALTNGGTGANSATSAKTNLGLGNIDNTSDLNKPVSTAQQTALDLKANLASPTFTGLPVLPTGTIGVTQSLNDNSTKLATTAYVANALADASGSITNSVADATTTSKGKILLGGDLGGTASAPVVMLVGGKTKDSIASTVDAFATATNTNLANAVVKRDGSGSFSATSISSNLIGNVTGNLTGNVTGNLTGTVTGNATNVSGVVAIANGGTGATTSIDARTNLGIGNINNTSDANKPVSTPQQAALDLKADLASPTFTGLPVLPTGTTGVTQSLNDNSTKLATTAYVANALADASGSITNSVADATTTSKGKILLGGDLGGTASAPVVMLVGGKTKDSIASTVDAFATATNTNLANAVVKRDGSGSFSATSISSNLIGNVTGNLTGNVTGNLTGTVTGNATNVSGVVAIANGGTGATTSIDARTNLGIGNINNTSDANKPVSTPQQAALDLKADLASPTFTGLPVLPTGTTGVTQSLNDNSTKLATTAYVANALADASGSITNSVADATTTSKGKILLGGDLGGTAIAPQVLSVGTVTKDQIVATTTLVNTATSSGTASTLVLRDVNGSFAGNLSGNATNVTGIVAIANGGTGTNSIAAMKTAYGLNNLDNTSDINKPISSLTQTALNLKINNSLIGVANGVGSLGADGKVPTAQLPSFSITSVSVVNSSASMLALTGLSVGSVAVRTDNATNFILTALPASTLSNWVSFSPAGVNVQSVNGATGAVALTGAANRISVTSNVFDIASTYAGQSSITTLGTIGTGVWNGTTIAINKGGTGATTANDGFNALAPAQSGHTGKFLTTNGTNTSWASIGAAGGWSTTGNSGTVDGTNFFGTTDAQPLNFQVGGLASGRLDVSSTIGQATLGYGAGASTVRNTSTLLGTKNTALGYQAIFNTNNGKENTALGYQALLNNFNGSSSTAIGYQAMSNANNVNITSDFITYNTAVGYQAMQGSATPASNTATYNTAMGYQALKAVTTGGFNNAIGVFALASNTTGSNNAALGYNALVSNTTGYQNTGIGSSALANNTTGIRNTAIGFNTLSSISTGSNNTAIGFQANVIGDVSNSAVIGFSAATSVANTIQLGNASIVNVNTSGAYTSANTTQATSNTTGALIIAGGAGIARNTFIGGNLNVAGTSAQTGAATFSGGITASGSSTNTLNNVTVQNTSTLAATNISGVTTISNSTASNATNTGALIVSGGTGIGGNLNVAGNTNISGATTITGPTTLSSISFGTTPTTNDNSTRLATTAYVMSTLASPSNGFAWSTTGNANMTDGSRFFGTTDAQPLNFQVGGLASGRLDVSSTIGQATLGYGAGASTVRNTSTLLGTKNTALGYQAIFNTNNGKENTALGYQALLNNFNGSSSTAIGYQAMSNANNVNITSDFITYNTAVGYQAMQGSATPASNTATYNTAMGYQALKAVTTGGFNNAIGVFALASNTTGSNNAALGYNALVSNTTGYQNTGIGSSALANNTTGIRNTAIGFNTLSSISTGSNNTAIGFQANVIGDVSNSAVIGFSAATSVANTIQLGNASIVNVNTSGAYTSANTTQATSNTTGALIIAGGAGIARNTFIGGNLNVAGTSAQTGAATFSGGITASGSSTNTLNNVTVQNTSTLAATNISGVTTISNSTASNATNTGALIVSGGTGIGGNLNVAGNTNISGATTITGPTTLSSISFGTTPTTNDNSTRLATTAYVMSTLASPSNGFAWSTTGNANMTDGSRFFGTTDAQPLNFQVGGLASGRLDVSSTIGQATLGYGAGASTVRNTSTLLGTKNTALGYQAIFNTNNGKENTALGYQALLNNFNGSSSTAIGYQAMSNANNVNITSDFITYNTAVGYQAMQGSATPASNTATYNTAMGYQALKAVTTGGFNNAIGVFALASNTTGSNNAALGYNALVSNTTGYQNTGIGSSALANNTTGIRNTAIGFNTLSSISTGSNNTAIGFQANVIGDVSNSAVIGFSAATSVANTIQLGNASIVNVNTSGAYTSANTTQATSNTTGALIIAGGAGIARNTFIGGNLNVAGTSAQTGAATFSGGITASGSSTNTLNNVTVQNTSTLAATNISGVTTISNSTASNATNTGALIVSGGTGIGGNLNVAGNTNISGATTITGPTTLSSISFGTTPTTNDNSTRLATTAYVMSTLASPSNGFAWSTTGNANMTDGSRFFGTTDAQPLNFQVGGLASGRLDVSSTIGQATLGYGAGASTVRNTSTLLGTKNTALGYQAIFNTNNGKENTALGYQALLNNFNGSSSTAIGYQAMSNANNVNITSDFITYNTAVGYQAMQGSATPASNTATYNTAMGYQALKAVTTGGFNNAIGVFALASNTTGSNNAALGYNALVSNTTGYQNTGIGSSALANNTTGIRNTAIGFNTLSSISTGSNNTAIGFQANVIGDVSNSAVIGFSAATSVANTIQLGNASIVNVNTSGAYTSANTTQATSNTTGALIIAGGAGIARNTFIGGNLNVAGTSAQTGAATFSGGITASGSSTNTLNNVTVQNTSTLAATNISGVTTISNSTASNATNTGALIVSGGTGIGGNLNVAGNTNISGATTITGPTTLSSISFGTTPTTNDNSTRLATTAYVMSTLASPSNGFAWSTTGNANMTDGSRFFGTTDAQPLNFQVGGLASGRLDVSSTIGQATLGYGAGASTVRNTSTLLGTKNTALGYQAIFNTNNGKENTALGYQALLNNFNGSSSTAIGYQAMSNANNVNITSDFITYNTAVGYQAMQGSATPASNTATYNTAMGYQALKAVTTGGFNNAIGVFALASNTTGSNNAALGYNALVSNTTGYQNTGIGSSALANNTTGIRNTAIGFNTLSSISTGSNNTAIGFQANVIGDVSNSAVIGFSAATSVANTIQLGNASIVNVNTSGAYTSANTTQATSNTTGALIIAGGAGIARNTFIGGNLNVAGTSAQTGAATFSGGITASGSSTNTLNNVTVQNTSTLAATNISGVTTISNSTASNATNTGALIVSGGTGIGGNLNVAGNTNISGATTITGPTTLSSISFGTTPTTNDNSTRLATTAYVMSTLASPSNGFAWSTTGNANMTDGSRFFGTTDAQPLNFQVGGLASGRLDVSSTIGQATLGYGAGASTVRNTSTLLGTKNTALGYQAIFNTNNGKENTALGYQALLNNFNGSSSTAIGYQAMSNANNVNITSDFITYNTAVGYQAMQGSATPASNTATYNTAMGYQALKAVTTGGFNNAIGVFALASNTTGSNNAALGYNALVSNTTGYQNTGIGSSALANNTTGIRNTAIGFNTLSSISTGSNNTAIGFNANVIGDVSNSAVIGSGASTSAANTIQLGNTSIVRVNTSGEIVTTNDITAKHIKGNSGALSITASTGAGTSPSAVSVTGTDMSGVVALTTGTSPSVNAVLATITYNTAFSTAPVVVITPANAATASLAAAQAVWVNITTTGFTINTNGTAVGASTAYKWNYVVIQ